MRVEDFLARLEGVHGDAPQWSARCPAHDDRAPSLTVGLGEGGRILVSCWAGCTVEDICHAAGVTVGDLFDKEAKRNESLGLGLQLQRALTPPLPSAEEMHDDQLALLRSLDTHKAILRLKGWNYHALAAMDIGLRGNRLMIPVRDLDGELTQYLRYWPESRPKMLATRGHKRTPLYVLHDAGPLWIVEGETDAISVACAGFAVIGAPGASAKAHAEWCEPARGRDVIVCMDHDEPGRKAAAKWAQTATHKGAASVRVVSWHAQAEGYDVSELLLELGGDPGRFRAELEKLAAAAEPFETNREAPVPTTAPDLNGYEPGEVILTPLSSFRVRRLRMLWRERVPVGRVGIVFGPPGLGKSTLLALMAADVTQAGGHVLIASAEDAPATTLMPRMIAANADVGLVDVLSTKAKDGDTGLVLPRDLHSIEQRMDGRAMLVIDPISAHLGDEINEWKEQDVRAQVLAPLAKYADETGCAVVLVKHPNRSDGSDPLARISGSGGFGAAARFVLLLGNHPDDVGLDPDERRTVLIHVKASENAKQPAMIFRRRLVGVDGEGGPAVVPRLELLDDQTHIAPEAVLEVTDPQDAGAFTDAIEFIRHELADGPKLSKQMQAAARERGDFSPRTLAKAKRALKIKSAKVGTVWWWEPPWA